MPRLDPAWLDAQYNNRARIPEHPQTFERWTRDASIARERSSRRLDIALWDRTRPRRSTCFLPPATTRRCSSSSTAATGARSTSATSRSSARRSSREGAMVVVPNYALAPAVTIEAIALQMVQALAWTWRHAALYGGNPRRIVVAGHSAGGHLAALLLTCRLDGRGEGPASRLARGRPVDLGPVRPGADPADAFPAAGSALDARCGAAAEPAPTCRRRAGRSTRPSARDESEEFLRQNELIRGAWGATAVPVCEAIPAFHHLSVLDDLTDPHGRLHRLALQLLRLAALKRHNQVVGGNSQSQCPALSIRICDALARAVA